MALTACKESETALTNSSADNSPPIVQEPVETTNSEEGDDRTGQTISDRDCDTVGNLPFDGIPGLNVLSSPRADSTAEVLALESSDEVIVSEALYLRVSAELAALRSAFPSRTNVEAAPCYPSRLIAELGDSFASTTLFETYNTVLRAQLAILGDGKTVVIRFDGIYNMNTLAEQYAALPNIDFATPDTISVDSSDICLDTVATDGHFYIFDQASDDCPSGCLSNNISGFTIDADGNINDLGSFHPQSDAEPTWFATAANCRAYL